MRRTLIDAVRDVDRRRSSPAGGALHPSSPWRRRVALASWLALGLVVTAAREAPAVTLKLTFSDGQPMTYGSACAGDGCLAQGAGVAPTDAAGEITLAADPGAVVEYRRDGIDLARALEGTAAGRTTTTSERTTVVLPRLLAAGAPAVDAVESEIVTRINDARAARGLAPGAINARLSAAADLHATWLDGTGLGLPLPVLSHEGPYGSDVWFRLGEVSFPEPRAGAEIAAAGMTPAQALAGWLASVPHRDLVLAPGPQLIGVANVGRVIVVDTHPPCGGCQPAAAAPVNGGAGAPTGAAGPAPAGGTPAASGVAGARPSSSSSCGRERLAVRRMRARRGRLRVRVTVRCMQPGARYRLTVLQRPARSVLTTRTIPAAGTVTLTLRPARRTHTLRLRLKRDGRAVAARSVVRRRG
jgi:uncharacterized protein YkwD